MPGEDPDLIVRNLDTGEQGEIKEMEHKYAPSASELYSKPTGPSGLYDESDLKHGDEK